MTLSQLKEAVASFAEERDWGQFHTPKNLSMALAGEAAELMEHFQWVEGADSQDLLKSESKRLAIEEELADVVIYALQFANRSQTDLSSAIRRKLAINATKYPVAISKGRSDKYDEL